MAHPRTAPALVLALAVLTTAALAPRAAYAQDPVEEGRRHFDLGVGLFDRNDFNGALAEFQRAWELSRRTSVLFNVAAAYQALHRYPEAIVALRRYLAESPELRGRERRQTEGTLRDLEALVARVRITVDPPDATVLVDGSPLPSAQPIVLGPGTHRVDATHANRRPAQGEFTVAAGDERDLQVVLFADAPGTIVGASPGGLAVVSGAGSSEPTLEVLDAPPGALVILDGAQRATAPGPISEGVHAVTVSAPGYRPWSGSVRVRGPSPVRVRVALAGQRTGLAPGWFWGATAAAGAFTLGATIAAVMALNAHSDYASAPSGPRVRELESTGRGRALAADLLGIGALGLGVAAVVLYLRTDFRASTSSARLVFSPLEGGAVVGGAWRF